MATGLPANLTDLNNEWVLDFSNFRSAWLRSKGDGITVAHPDTGWTMHPELVAPTYRRDLSRNFFEPAAYQRVCTPNNGPSARDRPGNFSTAHGTGTAGVLVSPIGHPDGSGGRATDRFPAGDPAAYVSGAAPEAVVIPFRVAEHPFMRDAEDVALAKCIYHCIGLQANHGIDVAVMSISLGGARAGTEEKIKTALAAARQHGIVMIAAAGQMPFNAGRWIARRTRPLFPGSSPDTICAAGCLSNHEPLDFAFYGEEVDITGPAFNVYMSRTKWNDDAPQGEEYRVERSNGTSYATALIAAACALWQSLHGRQRLITMYGRPRLHAAFKHCLKKSADSRAGWDTKKRGAGVLDVEKLLDEPLPRADELEQ